MRKLTTAEFVEQAQEAHGNKYDYSKAEYHTKKDKVCIICHELDVNGNEHGEFWQTPDAHTKGQGCPKCKFQKLSNDRAKDIDSFIKDANAVHNNKYDYSKFNYINCRTKGIIICPEHGEFLQDPANHLSGKGCSKCGRKSISEKLLMSQEEFISRCQKLNPDYNYSNTIYTGIENKITYICPIHGEITQNAHDHLHNHARCPKCNQSKGEFLVETVLKNLNINYVSQYRIQAPKDIRVSGYCYVDFYLPDCNIFIEYNGIQHYVPVKQFGGELKLEDQQIRDNYIRKFCKDNKIKLLEIPYIINDLKDVEILIQQSVENDLNHQLVVLPDTLFYQLLKHEL